VIISAVTCDEGIANTGVAAGGGSVVVTGGGNGSAATVGLDVGAAVGGGDGFGWTSG
jgi:hypothetical protein